MVAAPMNPWPIAPITDKDLNFAAVSYDFASFTANEQSELPSLEGALDTSLLDYAASIADQTTLLASLFSGLDDVLTVFSEIGGDDLESIFGSLSNAAGQGDLILSQYNGLIGDNSGTGGGGGGGGAAGGCDTLDFGAVQDVVNGSDASYKGTWTVQNNSNTPVHVKGATFNGTGGGHFQLGVLPGGQTLAPGASLTMTILFTPEFPGTYTATLTLLTDAPDPQPCLKLSGTGVGAARLG